MPSGCRCILLVVLVLSGIAFSHGPATVAQETARVVKQSSYLVLRAEDSELQRFLEQRDATKRHVFHLLLDGDALVDSKALHLDSFDWKQLSEDVEQVTVDQPRQSLQIRTYFSKSPGSNAEILRWTLEGFASAKLKFDQTRQIETHGTGFRQHLERAQLVSAKAEEPTEESAVGNEYVDVFPVRTFLSRLYTGGADCVVHVKPKFADDFGEGLPRSIRTSASVFARKIKFAKRKSVVFVFHYSPGDGDKAKRWFFDEGADALTEAMGFEEWSIQTRFE